ncbi:hypothetical protein FHX44_113291 [Pseudonocardia hierapolitana]|uniref:Glycosyltransferase RgtA/B/C/D-like domain-containing protein n=1 Tax=Pseudonocardia hierapolitana TaxID=1128676 RepID=A0A561SRA8_9PSEU|nr:hypothetical protein [Pseudonocardia hierapolitana]TWF77382.1 hypothetical protein FHX44_113291 [Pseudonocardia hierapolitana]
MVGRGAATEPDDRAAVAWWLRAAVAVGVPTAAFAAHALLYGRWIVDDAGITFAYARSIATGAGPVLQPGVEPVEGFSNPAWLGLLVLGRWVGLFDRGAWFGVPDYVAFPKLLALVLVAGVFACCYAVAIAMTRRPTLVTIVAGLVTAAVPSFVIWTMSGLENALLALAAAAIAAVLVRAVVAGRLLEPTTAVWCGLLAALAALTRPDGLVYAGAFPLAALLLLHRVNLGHAARAAALSLLVFAVPAGGYLAWRLAVFGEYLPNTAIAKSQGLPGLAAATRPGELVTYIGWPAALLAVAAVGAALVQPGIRRRALVVLLVPLALSVLAFGVLAPDWMGQLRFATPVWPLAALAAVVAAVLVAPQLDTRSRAVVAVLAVGASAVSGLVLVDGMRAFRAAPTAPLCLVAQNTGRAINSYAELVDVPDPVLAAPDIGGAALVSDLRLVDVVGLADPRIARFWAAGDTAGLRTHILREVRPTFLTLNPDWARLTGLAADPRLVQSYDKIATSPAGVTDWVRRDALRAGDLAALRIRAAQAVADDENARRSPRASCGDVLVPSGR